MQEERSTTGKSKLFFLYCYILVGVTTLLAWSSNYYDERGRERDGMGGGGQR